VADTPSQTSWSVHAQVEAILAGALEGDLAKSALAKSVNHVGVVQPGTFFNRYYLIRACRKVGDRERIRAQYPRWTNILEETGLTTFPEVDGNPRSDCHGWSAGIALSMIEDQIGLRAAEEAVGCNPLELSPDPTAPPLTADLCVPGGQVHVQLGRPSGRGRPVNIDTPLPVRLPATGDQLPPGRHQLTLPPG
jgi:hypothetical protein